MPEHDTEGVPQFEKLIRYGKWRYYLVTVVLVESASRHLLAYFTIILLDNIAASVFNVLKDQYWHIMASQEHRHHKHMTGQKELFQALFANLPSSPRQCLDALAEVNNAFRQAIADQLTPTVRFLLQEEPPKDAPGRRELAHHLNHVLRDVGLAVVDPISGLATTVVAEPYRLVLQSRMATAGRQTRSQNTQKLPPLDLVAHIRQEPIRTWQERTNPRRSSSPDDPGR